MQSLDWIFWYWKCSYAQFYFWFQLPMLWTFLTGTDSRKKIRTNCSVWSKIGTFEMSFLLGKSTAMIMPTRYLLVIYDTFQLRYCMKFYLKGHQNYHKSKSKVPKKCPSLSKFQSLKVWPLVSQVPIDEKFCAVPHFKALIIVWNISGWQEPCITFT